MKTFKTAYEFYKLPEDEQKALIGTCFKEENRPVIYYPIQLTEEGGWENYNKQQGIISIHPVMNYKGKDWFRVAAFSPDDLDMDLDFEGEEVKLRDQVREYLELYIATCPSTGVRYREVLKDIQAYFKAGEMTS